MHISICVCTYHRPLLLLRLLTELLKQEACGRFSYSVILVDNDKKESAKKVVQQIEANGAIKIQYCVEPIRNISLARNRAIHACPIIS